MVRFPSYWADLATREEKVQLSYRYGRCEVIALTGYRYLAPLEQSFKRLERQKRGPTIRYETRRHSLLWTSPPMGHRCHPIRRMSGQRVPTHFLIYPLGSS